MPTPPEPREIELMNLSDELSLAIRSAAACLRAITSGASNKDAAYLNELALAALEKGEAALQVQLDGFKERVRC